ncbi:SIR2 family NAD-dependent protein deacylase [Streptomyces sp. NRRL F-5755]|uniref:SIR2 family NAD-dependent protein deacylase n=1 Tax=Streptomyces sp. NRRL F-5755 TaxID=1519475 RepID=UPI000A80A852|nr:SIR2 family protein [Streptomyces sp. NRRL F-5755]
MAFVHKQADMRYVDRLPGGLRRALTAGRWLPIIGAGISAAATTEDLRSPPGWQSLGQQLSRDLLGPTGVGPLDALSAYADTYGRPQLVERLSELLFVHEIVPGTVHQAFAQLPFDIVVTTNIDFLLERAYEEQRRPCEPLLGESQLSLQRSPEVTHLLRFHGDLRHPDQLVITEDDYDGFLRRHPLLATCLSWWLLTREPVLFGYSLDDADLREILTLLCERLGRMTRPAWAILPADPNVEAARFQRRGIKAIVLDPDPKADRATVLNAFFTELRTMWEQEIAPQLQVRTDAATAELRRPSIAPQLALFVASRPLLALYRDFVFPSVPRSSGLLPLGIDDIRTRDSAMTPMAIDMALSKAAVVVYDTGRGNPLPHSFVTSRRALVSALVDVADPSFHGPPADSAGNIVVRPVEMGEWPANFIHRLQERIAAARPSVPSPDLREVLERLRSAQEHESLLLTYLALLENRLRQCMADEQPPVDPPTPNLPTVIPLSGGRMEQLSAFFGADFGTVLHAVRVRHDLMQNLHVEPTEIQSAADALRPVVQCQLGLPL